MNINKTNPELRKQALLQWLNQLSQSYKLELKNISSASSDASFRHYYRIPAADGTVIAMDSPPCSENTEAFVQITKLLNTHGITVPSILEQDIQNGFLLISDLGNKTYYQVVQDVNDNKLQSMYRSAIKVLIKLQKVPANNLPKYSSELLANELQLFTEWYAQKYKGINITNAELNTLQNIYKDLAKHNSSVPYVFVHRDFHSPNLMMPNSPNDDPGVIDYQDALYGPITYDIASLVMDARTTWEEEQQLDWAIRYWEEAKKSGLPVSSDFNDFHVAYELMSLQRNLRVLGVFSRLSIRDNKNQYMQHIPRVNKYIRQVALRYGAFDNLVRILDKIDNIETKVGYTF